MEDSTVLLGTRSFLPEQDPLQVLGKPFQAWEQCARELPHLLLSGIARRAIKSLRVITVEQLRPTEYERAMLLLSFLAHAFVWGGMKSESHIPRSVAIPLCAVAKKLGRPPVLSYASYALYNWRRLNLSGYLDLDNLALLQPFVGGQDEAWFILVHVVIEAKASLALRSINLAQGAVEKDDHVKVRLYLAYIAESLGKMHRELLHMPEKCDPFIYYHRVRPYIHGWKDNPDLPEGVIYEGVEEYGGKPQQFRGETGAQSSIIPSLDAALGIAHEDDPLRPYLMEMREYMPPQHRAFIEIVQRGPSIRDYVISNPSRGTLQEAYNACVELLTEFRSTHLEYASRYIHQQSQQGSANPTDVGTGGTPFMSYLAKHRDETEKHRIP